MLSRRTSRSRRKVNRIDIFISDIHNNSYALQAVLRHIKKTYGNKGIIRIFCLGDVFGYGPHPLETVDMLMRLNNLVVIIRGNHDLSAEYDKQDCIDPRLAGTEPARESMEWTRMHHKRGKPGETKTQRERRLWFCRRMVTSATDKLGAYDPLLLVHGSPSEPEDGYVKSEYITTKPETLVGEFALVSGYCFNGHTHRPAFYTLKSTKIFLTVTYTIGNTVLYYETPTIPPRTLLRKTRVLRKISSLLIGL